MAVVGNCPERMHSAAVEFWSGMDTAVDTCPKRMDAADAEAPRFEAGVEFWSGMQSMMGV